MEKIASAKRKPASLNWSNWKLCGRVEETKQLEHAYLTRKECDLLLVTGPEGVGKTALTEILRSKVADDAGLLVRGSFRASQTEPYAAFVEALTDLVEQLRLISDFECIQSEVKQAIAESGAEQFLVKDGLPILASLMHDDRYVDIRNGAPSGIDIEEQQRSARRQKQRHQNISASDRQYGFINAVTKIVQAVGSVFPLVIVVDNLMWADPGSIRLLESLCLTGKLANLLLVATCRGEEVGFHDPLSVTLRRMEDRGVRLTDINLQPLVVDDVSELLLSLLDHDSCDQSLQELATTIHSCTNGFPLLVCEVLGAIEKEVVDSDILHDQLGYEDFIAAKIRKIPTSWPALRILASLGGGAVHESVLIELLQGTADEFKRNIINALECDLVTTSSDGVEYTFKHANIQSAVYNLISPDERKAMHFSIAERLCAWMSEEQLEANIFVVVEQYRHGRERIPQHRIDRVAQLCLRAARRIANMAAFSSAEEFIRFGHSLLAPRTKWRDSYSLALALTNATIELEFCQGNHDEVDKLHQEIIHNSRSSLDSVTSYNIHICSLGARGCIQEAIAEGLDALETLGERLPRRFLLIRTFRCFLKLKRIMKDTPDEDILSLPFLSDVRIQAVSSILHITFIYVFLQRSDLVPIVSMRLIELTFRYGLSPMSSVSFAIFGMVEMMGFHDYEGGYRYCELALKLMDTINCRELISRTNTVVYGFVKPYKEPLRSTLKPLDHGYRLNMLTGDIEMAITSKSISIGNSFQAGVPLFQVLSELRKLFEVCNLHNQRWVEQVARCTAQFAQNLSGRQDESQPFELTGEFMTEKVVEADIVDAKNDIQLAWLYFLKFMMAVYLCDESISREAENLGRRLKKCITQLGFYTIQQQVFHEGILCCFLASAEPSSTIRRRTLIARAKRKLTALKKVAVVCPANYLNKSTLLEAEIESAVGEKPYHTILLLYEESAAAAAKEGLLHEQALSLEKAGRHLLKNIVRGSDNSQVRAFLAGATRLYEEYGSQLKAELLRLLTHDLDDSTRIPMCLK